MFEKLIIVAVIKKIEIRYPIYLPEPSSEEKDVIRETLSTEIKAWTGKNINWIFTIQQEDTENRSWSD